MSGTESFTKDQQYSHCGECVCQELGQLQKINCGECISGTGSFTEDQDSHCG